MRAHFQTSLAKCSYWNKVKVFVVCVLNNLKNSD